jgi:protein-tyrosine phosphatase
VVNEKELIVLDIPDDYQFMDEELVDLIKLSVSAYL